jgi:LAS superfamily LD-carboxypeptidase LdcB
VAQSGATLLMPSPADTAAPLAFSEAFLTGRDARPLAARGDLLLLPEVWAAFDRLAAAARTAGFELRVASAYRSFSRQLQIFNGKARGERPTLDDRDEPVELDALPVAERIGAILRFSALPGASRHHFGTDIDVYDAAATPRDYRLALSQAEVCACGLFDPLHCWLDERIARGEAHGFYRPYDRDRGGVAPERWHLSYAPLAAVFSEGVDAAVLRRCWAAPEAASLCWREALEEALPALVERYLRAVAAPPALLPG